MNAATAGFHGLDSSAAPDKGRLLRLLLVCGVVSSVLYVAMNGIIPLLFEGYNIASQTVSELSAIGAPTRPLWVRGDL